MKELKGTLVTYKVFHTHEWQVMGNKLRREKGGHMVPAEAFVRKVGEKKNKTVEREHGDNY